MTNALLLAATAFVSLAAHAQAQQTVTISIPFAQPPLLASQLSGGGISGGLNNILMNSAVSGVVLQHNGGVLDVDHDLRNALFSVRGLDDHLQLDAGLELVAVDRRHDPHVGWRLVDGNVAHVPVHSEPQLRRHWIRSFLVLLDE